MLGPWTWQAGSLSRERPGVQGSGARAFLISSLLWGILPESWRRGKGGRKYPRDHSSMYPSIYCVLRTEKTEESKVARDSLLPGFQTWAIGLR